MRLLDERLAQPTPVGEVYTAQKLEQLPSNERYELIRGELCAMPNNSADHGNKTMRLSAPVALFVEENDLGECFAAETRLTIEQNPDTVLAPDFAFITRARLSGIPPKGYLSIAPDLVIETRSPNDTRTEFALKVARWLQAGTQLVWALDPAMRAVTVHQVGVSPQTLTIEGTLSGGDVLPGFTLSLCRLFREVSSGQ
jgi:Uma2 family endonuclease